MKLHTIPSLFMFLFLLSFSGCSDETFIDDNRSSGSGRPLADGELCYIGFTNSVPDVGTVTTRAIPEGKRTVLHDFTNHPLKGKDGNRAGWVTGEVRTEYDEEVRQATARRGAAAGSNATTRAFNPAKQLFGPKSKFRMLVFAGTFNGTVDMTSPVANMVCQVNSDGTGAKFISPTTELGLLKGKYTFICFPADEKYNKWQVGSSEGYNQVPIGLDEDFVSMKIADQAIENANYKVDLSQFTRFCYELTVKFSVNEKLGYLLFPQDKIILEISDDGTTAGSRVINTKGTFDLKNQTVSNYSDNAASFKDTLVIGKDDEGKQTFTAVANMMIANNSASHKLTIKYPRLTVMKPAGTLCADGNPSKEDSVFTIKAGTFTTSKAVKFEAGKSYTITLAVGEQVKGISVTFRNEAGDEHTIVFARSQLYYNKSEGKWAIGKEQCDYGYNENGVAPNTGDSKLVTGNINYYFMYGCLNPFITTNTGNNTDSEAGGMTGYYSGASDLNTIGRDPCAKLGDKWMSPTRDIIYWMGYLGTNYYNGSEKSKPATDYFAVDEEGKRLKTSGNPYWGTYTPTDNRSNKTPVRGMWIGLSTAKATSSSNTDCNGTALFLPAPGYRNYGGTSMYDVGGYGGYWSSQQYPSSNGQHFGLNGSGYYLNYDLRSLGQSVRCCLPE